MGDDLKNLGIYVSQVIFLALKPPHTPTFGFGVGADR